MSMKEQKRMCNLTWFSPKSHKSSYFLYIVFLFCFEPKLFAKFPLLNAFYAAGIAACFGCMALLYLSSRTKPTPIFLVLVAYRMSFGLQTFASRGDILMWGYMSLVLMTMCLAIDYYIADKGREMLAIILNILIGLLVINLILSLLWPGGIYDMHFIGIRTRLTDVIIPVLVLALLLDYLDRRAISFRTVLCFVLSLLTFIQHEVMTAVLGVGVMMVAFFFMLAIKRRWLYRAVNVISLSGIGLAVNMLIVHIKITLKMGWFFEKVLNKSATLTDRVLLWDRAVAIVREKLLFGHGMAENGNFVPGPASLNANALWQAHNQWLQILYDGGLLTLVTFLQLIFMSHRGLDSTCARRPRAALLAGMFSIFVMMTVEIFSYTPYFFLLIFIGYYANSLQQVDEVRIGVIERKALAYARY